MHGAMGSSIVFAAASAALAVQSAAAMSAVPLQPSGPWAVNYADNMCVLGRQFGTGNETVTLAFRPGPLSDEMRIALFLRGRPVAKGGAKLQLDSLPAVEAGFWGGATNEKGLNIVLIDTKRSEIEALASAKQFRIKVGTKEFSFAPTQVKPAMSALMACEKDLLRGWGMQQEAVDAVATPAQLKGDFRDYFSTDDYPNVAVAHEQQGTAGIRFWVGTDGKVSGCKLVESSGSPSIDEQTCRVAEARFRFEPARTGDGKPLASLSFARIRWELPDY